MAGFQRRAWATGHPSAHPLQASLPACPANSFGSRVASLIRTCNPAIHLQTEHLEQAPIHPSVHPSSHPSTDACYPRLRYVPACLRKHTYIPSQVHTYTHVHMCTCAHKYTHPHTHTSMPSEPDQRHHALFWNARPPVQAVGSATGGAGIYGLTPVGCLSETSSPCRTAQDPHPQSHAINKGSIKAPAFALPLASRTGSPTHTLKRSGSLAPWSPQSLQRVGQTASAPSAISNLHAAGSHAA